MDRILIYDYLILLPYLLLFYAFARIMAKHEEPRLRKYLMTAFWLRMLGCVLYSMVMQYYYGYGDSFTYFKGGNFFTDKISEDPSNIRYLFAPVKEIAEWYNASPESDPAFSGYFVQPAGNMVMRISAFLSYLSFHRFLIISLFFGFFSFYGQWKMFLVFDDINNKRRSGLLALATLYTPSIWFWGSGLMKDSLCLGALGIMIYILYNLYSKKKVSIIHFVAFLVLFYVVAIVKSYITSILLASLALTVIFIMIRSVKNFAARLSISLFLLLTGVLILSQVDLSGKVKELSEEAVSTISVYQRSYQAAADDQEDSKGGFNIKELNPSIGSILMQAPAVIFTCLYRPFIWESRKVMIFLTALESTLLILCTIYLFYKAGILRFFGSIFKDEYLFFCFVLSMLFAMVIGFTTFNFGTMIRYKIIFLPFFYFLMLRIYILASAASKSEVPSK